MVSSQRKIIFDIQVDPYWPKWETKCSKLLAKDFETSEFHQNTCNRYLMWGFVSAHIPSNATSHLKLRLSYKALQDDLVLPSAITLSNICRSEYAQTVDAIKKQLPSRNRISLALDGWTSPKKVAIHQSLLTLWIEIGHYVKFDLPSMRLIACSLPISRAN